MPPYLLSGTVWAALWPIPVTAMLVTGGLTLAHRPASNYRSYFVVVLAFSLLGLVTGMLAGFSRQPAIGAVLPAVLSLVGGLGIYLVGGQKTDQGLLGICIIALSLDLMVGATWGAVLRESYENVSKTAAYQQEQATIEAEVRDFRRELQLPDNPAAAAARPDDQPSGAK